MSSPIGRHPHFQSPIFWRASIREGLDAARSAKDDRCVLVQLGRLACGGSRALVEKTVAKEEIRELLDADFVCVAEDLDRLEPDAQALIARVPGLDAQARTPFCIYLAPDGRVLHHSSGGRPPAVFLRDLIEASARRRQPG
jgi:uncharacterized protein YyaL (SSP411 family)